MYSRTIGNAEIREGEISSLIEGIRDSFTWTSNYDKDMKRTESVNKLLSHDGCFFCSTPNSLLQPKLDDGKTPRNPFHLKEFTVFEYQAIMGKFFENVEIYGQELEPNFLRFRKVLDEIRKQAAERDFKMWTNPLMKLGRLFQKFYRNIDEWDGIDYFFMPAEINDVRIDNSDLENKRYFISKCRA
jgi:hypothetical protein